MGRRSALRLLAAAVALLAGLALPLVATAHPLGNFTINHYAELRIAPDQVDLDVILDMAEIPTFQERQTMDADEDGSVDDTESASWAGRACAALARDLRLATDDAALPIGIDAASVSFPPGAGGLSTLRLECRAVATLPAPITSRTSITFADDSYPERIGWREILATGVGTLLETHGLPATSPSHKLTEYPADLIAAPLDTRSAAIVAMPDPAAVAASAPVGSAAAGVGAAPAAPGGGAVPGGVGGELPAIFRSTELTPLVLLASLLTALVIGAGHALTPGHGKTLMAAYLVGSRGTAVHAVGLGMSVAVSHTLGILVLALIILGAGSVLPPDVVYRVTPVIAAVSIVAIGAWMLLGEVRRRRTAAGSGHEQPHEQAHGHEHANGHPQPHAAAHTRAADDSSAEPSPGEHSHGGVRHSHLPAPDATLSWRGLFVLGLAGGLIPSTSALLILLGSIAAGRPAFGLILVVAFGLGMAAVMTGVGLAMILARGRLDRMPRQSSLGRLATAAPLLASVAVLGLGLVLTWQAVAGRPVL
jgi:ABC-type nickel/cobalt efflux system permease component RcnA